jgi:hypothetical protein
MVQETVSVLVNTLIHQVTCSSRLQTDVSLPPGTWGWRIARVVNRDRCQDAQVHKGEDGS